MKPTKPEHWIGKTGVIARAVFARVPALRIATDPVDRSYLFTGSPGVGKTTLAEALALVLAGHRLAVEKINGQSLSVDVVRKWQEDGHYFPLYGEMRVKIVDEIDAASLPACNQLRTHLDELPPRSVFIATTNKPIKNLQEQLQSRFKVWYFAAIPAETIATWLAQHYPGLPPATIRTIAYGCKGNVRAAKADALSHLEVMAV